MEASYFFMERCDCWCLWPSEGLRCCMCCWWGSNPPGKSWWKNDTISSVLFSLGRMTHWPDFSQNIVVTVLKISPQSWHWSRLTRMDLCHDAWVGLGMVLLAPNSTGLSAISSPVLVLSPCSQTQLCTTALQQLFTRSLYLLKWRRSKYIRGKINVSRTAWWCSG